MIEWAISNDGRVLEYLRTMPEELVEAVFGAIDTQTHRLERRVLGKLNGGLLKTKSGKLIEAIPRGTSVRRSKTTITGTVGLGGADAATAIAGGANEFGASIPAHFVEAVNVSRMKFAINGKFHFQRMNILPASKIPERSFLRSSLNEMRSDIEANITAAAQPPINVWSALF